MEDAGITAATVPSAWPYLQSVGSIKEQAVG
jgi:hypothetical protein